MRLDAADTRKPAHPHQFVPAAGHASWVSTPPEALHVPALLSDQGGTTCVVNDTHSGLNETIVGGTIAVSSVPALQHVVRSAAAAGLRISIAGGRHAMGGQQFGTGTVLLDMTGLGRVLELDSERGLVVV